MESETVSVDVNGKGLGETPNGFPVENINSLKWNLLKEDVSFPVAVINEEGLENNLEWMKNFCEKYGVQLCPHGKTTMCPGLFHRQLQKGAWGITLATASQVKAAFNHGIRRIFLANQLVGKSNMNIIANLMIKDQIFDFYCIVDSPENVRNLGEFFHSKKLQLKVLIELGVSGGRTGVRDIEQEEAVRMELKNWPETLHLVGLEVYEGLLTDSPGIEIFLTRAIERITAIQRAGEFRTNKVLLSGAGSAWFDLVAEVFAPGVNTIGFPTEIILRPGCYVVHDAGSYEKAFTRMKTINPVIQGMNNQLISSLQVWACVQSICEKGRAIITMGKRDCAFDSGFPIPSLHFRPSKSSFENQANQPTKIPNSFGWKIYKMMDQHAFLEFNTQNDQSSDIAVGDLIAFDPLHPCLTMDKWKQVLIVDSQFNVVQCLPTYF